MAKLDANHLEVVIFAIANYARGATGAKGALGVALGSLSVLLLIILGLLKTKMLWRSFQPSPLNWTLSVYQDKMNPEATSLQQTSVFATNEAQASSSSSNMIEKPMLWLDYVSKNRYQPKNRGTALYYIFQYSRSLILAILTLNLTDKTWVLLMLAIFVEVVYTAYLIKYSDFRVQIERYSQLALQSLTILYLLLKAISTSEKLSDTARFTNFSNLLAVLLLMIVVVPIFLLFCAAVDIFYPFMSQKEKHVDKLQSQNKMEIASPQNFPQIADELNIGDEPKQANDCIPPIPDEAMPQRESPSTIQLEIPDECM